MSVSLSLCICQLGSTSWLSTLSTSEVMPDTRLRKLILQVGAITSKA